jgi:hypothetical protein
VPHEVAAHEQGKRGNGEERRRVETGRAVVEDGAEPVDPEDRESEEDRIHEEGRSE